MKRKGEVFSSFIADRNTERATIERVESLLGSDDVVESIAYLTPLQEAMLFHSIATKSEDLYVVQQRIEIDGKLDLPSFREAWSLAVSRHEPLRTIFNWEQAGRPVQIVCRDVEVPIEFVDFSEAPDPSRLVDAAFAADLDHGYSLDRPPLMRIALHKVAADKHVLLWSQHHLVQDGWSSSIVLDEVFAAHDSFSTNQEPVLPPAQPFTDYISWLENQAQAVAGEFWRDHLAGFDRPTRMISRSTTDAPPAPARLFHELSETLTAQVHDFARGTGLTVNSVLVGALTIALSRYTGQLDVATGFVGAGRPPDLDGVETMVGMFINTLALRARVDNTAPVVDWLRYVQERQSGALEYGYTGLTDIQSVADLPPGTALTDTLFAYWAFGGSGASPSGATNYRTVAGNGRTSFPFSITVEAASPITIGLDYDSSVFPRDLAEQFLSHYANLLGSIGRGTGETVGDLQLLTEAEMSDIDSFNNTAVETPTQSVVDSFRHQVRSGPDATALRFGDKAMTYRELDEKSEQLAAHLIEAAGFASIRVALYLPRSPEMVTAMLGVLKAGAAYVPIDRHLPAERVRFLLEDSEAHLIVTVSELSGALPDSGPAVLTLPLPDDPGEGLDFDIPVGGSDPAYVMYTSGSTGLPKGVMVSHRNLINYVSWAWKEYGQNQPVSFPLYTSPGFDLTVTSIFVPLISGGSIAIYPDDDVRDLSILQVFVDDQVDVVKLTPSHLSLLEPSHFRTSRIRSLVVGGEALRTDLAEEVHRASQGEIAIYNEYGPTEATVGCMIHRYEPSDGSPTVPIGRPAANTRIYLLDEGLSVVPSGVAGEIYVGGSGVASGYIDRPELTAERFVTDPFRDGLHMYRTGDLAIRRHDGSLEYLGRTDDQVKLRGNRIEPAEIEAALAEHPSVLHAAVAVREPRPGDQRLVGYYVPNPDVPGSVTELRDHLRARLPEFMVTRHLVRIDELPLTGNGKLDRGSLPDTIGEVASSIAFVAPRNAEERLVGRLASNLLGIEAVSITDNFFELGGHSILAMRLIATIHAETGIRISPRVVLLNPLAQVAAALLKSGAHISTAYPAQLDPGSRADSVATTAHFFGDSLEPLFGIHHAPTGGQTRNHGVLLCPPLGWEYMRTHWAMRQIARHLVSAGFDVLRFDYFATGDSSGRSGEGNVPRWLDDIGAARDELVAASGVHSVSIVGVRLGATLAAMAASTGLAASHLVMWDPIINGNDYVSTLVRMNKQTMSERSNSRRITEGMMGDDLMGFPYPYALRAQLDAIDLLGLDVATPSTVIASQPLPGYHRLAETRGSIALEVVEDAGAWDDVASTQAALLPSRIPRHIASVLGGGYE